MTERRPVRPPPPGDDPLAQWNDHLGRLLAQADRLLAEWRAHADGIGERLRREGAGAGEVLHRALEGALADAAQMSAQQLQRSLGAHADALTKQLAEAQRMSRELEAHLRRMRGEGGVVAGGPDRGRLTLALAASANLLVLAGIFVVLWRSPGTPAPVTPPIAAALADAPAPTNLLGPDAGLTQGPVDAAAPVTPPRAARGCDDIVPPQTPFGAARLVQECANRLCAPLPAIKVDGDIRAGGALGKLLVACKPDDARARDLVVTMRALAESKGLYKLACPLPARSAGGGHTVTVAWLLECPGRR